MSVGLYIGYAARQVEKGEWTQEYANKFLENLARIDLEQDELDGEMMKRCSEKLKELKS